jgi:hypothetical protein
MLCTLMELQSAGAGFSREIHSSQQSKLRTSNIIPKSSQISGMYSEFAVAFCRKLGCAVPLLVVCYFALPSSVLRCTWRRWRRCHIGHIRRCAGARPRCTVTVPCCSSAISMPNGHSYNRAASRPMLQIGKSSRHSLAIAYDGSRHKTLPVTPYINIRIDNLPANTTPSQVRKMT